MRLLLIALIMSFAFAQEQTVNVYLEKRIVDYMIGRGFGHYETLMVGEATPERPDGRHRNYLRTKPQLGDMVILLDAQVLIRLRGLKENPTDLAEFDRALQQAKPAAMDDPGTDLPDITIEPVKAPEAKLPHHTNKAFIGCLVDNALGNEVVAICEDGLQRFPTKPSWRWPARIPIKAGTPFFYERSGNCRVVHGEHDHAVVFDERRAAINCDP